MDDQNNDNSSMNKDTVKSLIDEILNAEWSQPKQLARGASLVSRPEGMVEGRVFTADELVGFMLFKLGIGISDKE
jgi:hypothetical protein